MHVHTYFRHLEEDGDTSDRQSKCARTELDENGDGDDVMDVEAPPPGVVKSEGVLGGREVSVSRLFSSEDRKIALQVVWSHGGRVIPQLKGEYHIMPLEVSANDMTPTGVTMVTMIWLVSRVEVLM